MGYIVTAAGVLGMVFSIVFGMISKTRLKKQSEKVHEELNRIYKV